MSFICGFCHKPSKPGVPARMIVTERREVSYGGTQIVREKQQCSACYEQSPEAVATRMADGRQYLTAEKKVVS